MKTWIGALLAVAGLTVAATVWAGDCGKTAAGKDGCCSGAKTVADSGTCPAKGKCPGAEAARAKYGNTPETSARMSSLRRGAKCRPALPR